MGLKLGVRVRVWAPMTRVCRWYAALTLALTPALTLAAALALTYDEGVLW